MFKTESIDARPLARGSYLPAPARHLPRIVSRSLGRPVAFSVRQPTRLRLVPARGFATIERRDPRRTAMRLRIVESVYVAAAFGTALVIWWSAR